MRDFMNDAGKRDLGAAFGTWAGAKDYLLHPWSATFSKLSDDSAIGPLFFLTLPLAAFGPFAPGLLILRALFLPAWAYWSLSSTVTRYFLPSLPLAAALFAAGIEEGLRGWPRRAIYALCALVFCANLYWINLTFYANGLGEVASGLVARSEFLRRETPAYSNPSYAAEEFINRDLGPGARLLFLGEARGFHCERDYVASSFYDRSPLAVWLAESRSPEDLRERLRREGITDILLNRPELARLKDAGRWEFSKEESARLLGFWNGFAREVFSDAASRCSVYEIVDGRGAPRRGTPPENPLYLAR